jgi:hypothetical protein
MIVTDISQKVGMLQEGLNLPSINRLAEATEKIASQGEAQASSHRMTMEQAGQVARKQRRTVISLSVGLVVSLCLVCALSVKLMDYSEKALSATKVAAVGNPDLNKSREELALMAVETANAASALKSLKSQQAELRTTFEATLEAKRKDISAEINRLKAMQEAVSGATKDLANLQRLNQAYQFRLLRNDEAKVFVKVDPAAKPFQLDGQTYIEVPQN